MSSWQPRTQTRCETSVRNDGLATRARRWDHDSCDHSDAPSVVDANGVLGPAVYGDARVDGSVRLLPHQLQASDSGWSSNAAVPGIGLVSQRRPALQESPGGGTARPLVPGFRCLMTSDAGIGARETKSRKPEAPRMYSGRSRSVLIGDVADLRFALAQHADEYRYQVGIELGACAFDR